MLKNKNTVPALIMIVVLAVIQLVLMRVNHERESNRWAEYEAALVIQNEKKNERKTAAAEKEERRAAAALAVRTAAASYIPGVIFYSDMSELDKKYSYPNVIRTLMVENVYNIPIKTVNIARQSPPSDAGGYLPIVFLSNAGTADGAVFSLLNGAERYIVIGDWHGTAAEAAEYEAYMTQTFGGRYINLRAYLSSSRDEKGKEEGMASLGMKPTPEDRKAMKEGRVPPSFLTADGTELNIVGHRLTAFLTYAAMEKQGYFAEIEEAAKAYEHEKDSL